MPESEDRDEVAVGRPFWSGTVTFGLVSIPVDLLPGNRPRAVSLRMVSPEGHPLARRYFTTRDDRELEWEDIVRGYELEKDSFVVVEDDELERLAPERTRDIDLRAFVKVSDIDPIYFERAYYLTPAGNSTKAYRLLARVMEESGHAGIATFVMRAKEYLVAILAENGILHAETLRFADELCAPGDIGLPGAVKPPAAETAKFVKEIAKLAKSDFDPRELADKSSERLLKLVDKKARSGKDVVGVTPEGGDSEGIVDLVAILQRSLRGEGSGSARGNGKRSTKRRKAAADKAPAKTARAAPRRARRRRTTT